MVRQGAKSAAVVAALWAAGAGAQEGFDSSRASADVSLSGIYTDNFYYGTAAEPVESALGAVIAPRAIYKATKGRFDLLATAGVEAAAFNREPADDYEDGGINLNTSWLATRRGRLDLRAGFQRSHDPFGINRTENATVRDQDLDIWHSMQGGMLFHYGAPEATLNAEVGLSALEKSYQTNEAATRFLGYTSTSLNYTVFYNFSPKTAALFDFIRSDIQLDESFGAIDTRSGDEYRVRAGVRWLATGKTSGDLRVGTYRREFEEVGGSEQGLDWQATVQWAPRARTLIDLEATRGSQESYRADTQVNITRSAVVRWKQYWGARASSQLSVGQATTEFVGIARKDTAYNVRLGLDYMLSQSLSAVMAADSFNRTSNEPTSEFDRVSATVGIRLQY
ncbi:MAG: outer membrane beta-barrel protein [Steroidobacteraceae bacterium]